MYIHAEYRYGIPVLMISESLIYSIGFSLLSAPSPFSLCTLHFALSLSVCTGILPSWKTRWIFLVAKIIRDIDERSHSHIPILSASHFNLEMMMYACVRQLHGAYGAGRAEKPLAYCPYRTVSTAGVEIQQATLPWRHGLHCV